MSEVIHHKATLTFNSRESANRFCKAWSRETLTDHDMSAVMKDGSYDVTVYNITEKKMEFIENWVKAENS